jgi:RecJ-like exonuclease
MVDSMCRPAGVLKKLQRRLVIEAITPSTLENGLMMTNAQALSFVEAYYSNEAIRLNQNAADALDTMLEHRALKMIGWTKYKSLLGGDLQDMQAQARHQALHQELDQKISSMQQKMVAIMSEIREQVLQHTTGLQTKDVQLSAKSNQFSRSQPAKPPADPASEYSTAPVSR